MDRTIAEILDVAEAMLSERLDLVTGCRRLNKLLRKMGVPNPAFGAIAGFDSETDYYPQGEARRHYSQEYLERVDKEVAE